MICYLRVFKVYQFIQNNKQNNSKNQYMYGQCDDFFGCELLSMNYREDEIGDLQKDNLNFYKSQNPTGVDQENSYLQSIKTLSIKKVLPKFQISFQKDFMKEHINVFAGVYSNYREFFSKSWKQNQYQKFQEHNTFHQDQQCLSVSFLLNHYDHSLSQIQKNQFLKDLIYQDRLLQFLTLVIKNSSLQDSLKLILVGRKVWMMYISHQKNNFSISEIIKLTDKICKEEVFQYSQNLFAPQTQQNKLTANQIQEFIMKFSVTILLVINEYFENPYFGDNESERRFKRTSDFSFFSESSDEDGQSFCNGPTKKRKLSF